MHISYASATRTVKEEEVRKKATRSKLLNISELEIVLELKTQLKFPQDIKNKFYSFLHIINPSSIQYIYVLFPAFGLCFSIPFL